jgi:outer membrane lipoprotein SlyB
MTGKDKVRTGVGVAGSAVGGAIGGVIGGLGGPAAIATVPIGRVVGSALGEGAATYVYDHQDDIRRKLDDTKRWMKARQAQVNRAAYGFEHAFDGGLPPYSPYLR